MKNIIKLLGNRNQAQRAKVPLLIIALVAVIGFSFTACGGGGGGGNIGTVIVVNNYTQPITKVLVTGGIIYWDDDEENEGINRFSNLSIKPSNGTETFKVDFDNNLGTEARITLYASGLENSEISPKTGSQSTDKFIFNKGNTVTVTLPADGSKATVITN